METSRSTPLLSVRGLRVAVAAAEAAVRRHGPGIYVEPYGPRLPPAYVEAIHDVDLDVWPGEVVAIVGESGSGKSLTAMGALGLLGPGARVVGGTVDFDGVRLRPTARLVKRRRRWWRRSRRRIPFMEELLDEGYRRALGSRIGVLFQEPVLSWSPTEFVGQQAGEALATHTGLSRQEIEARVLAALGETQLPRERSFFSFRHQLSRGQAQRAMLAAALVKAPALLVADEPFSGLDASVAAAISDLMRDMRRRRDMAMLLITHDLAAVAAMADRVLVMYGGRIVEEGAVGDIYYRPRHPYTAGLLASIPGSRELLEPIAGEPPRITRIPDDRCAFAPRCPHAEEICRTRRPTLERWGTSAVACVRQGHIELRGVRRMEPRSPGSHPH